MLITPEHDSISDIKYVLNPSIKRTQVYVTPES